MINLTLEGKKVLLLSVQTFNYEKVIADKLRSYGAKVDYYDERPTNSLFAKGIIRLKRSLYQKKIDNYYKHLLKKVSSINYDYLFVIRGEVVPSFFLEQFREANPACKLLFYTWDSFTNHTHPITILKFFDKKFTFDSNDAAKYDLSFRPLFYIQEYEAIRKQQDTVEFDLLFLGTAHSDRYKIGNEVIKWCSLNNLSSFAYYYMHGRLVFLFKRFFDKTFEKFDYKKLSFKSLTASEIINLYTKSSVILDINHPGQNGLTMRTFEALGAGKKIITTNKEVVKYPFYDENNILVIDRENPVLNLQFFDRSFVSIDGELLEKMSLSGWVYSIFVESEPDYWLKGYK